MPLYKKNIFYKDIYFAGTNCSKLRVLNRHSTGNKPSLSRPVFAARPSLTSCFLSKMRVPVRETNRAFPRLNELYPGFFWLSLESL